MKKRSHGQKWLLFVCLEMMEECLRDRQKFRSRYRFLYINTCSLKHLVHWINTS